MPLRQLLTPVLAVGTALGAAGICAACGYALRNDSGHSGFDPRWLWGVQAPLLLAVGLGAAQRTRLWKTAAGTAVVGALLPPLLSRFAVLMEYNDWLKSGQPPPPSFRIPLVAGYLAAYLLYLAYLGWSAVSRPGRSA